MRKRTKRTPSTKKEPGVSSSKRFFCRCTFLPAVLLSKLNVLTVWTSWFSIFRSKTKPKESCVESLDTPTPGRLNDAADVGCETSSGIKELVDKEQVAFESSLGLESQPSDKVLSPSDTMLSLNIFSDHHWHYTPF